ncbi:MAG: hypothetical protein JXR80_11735 [Deltaproteobacteria bacterium]|nr:hypothetical protein [Deltaproteobacteria bacterium]
MKSVRIFSLVLGFWLLLWGLDCRFVAAAVVVKTAAGQAVLVEGSEKARSQAVLDALGEALNRYLYDDLAVSREFASEIEEKILKRRKLYVKSYEIQSERTLGDLYQVELKVELQGDLLEQELRQIERREKRQVERLTLVVLAPATDPELGPDGARSPVLEPTLLLQQLGKELDLYGFRLELVNPVAPELEPLLLPLLEAGSGLERPQPQAAWFEGVLPGDLIIVVRSSRVREEKIVSLQKSFWRSQAEIVFIDLKNRTITPLPEVTAKVINADYLAGAQELTETLTARVQQECLDHLLRDYVVPRESQSLVVLQCRGFRRPQDFAFFREQLQELRMVQEVSLQALAAGSVEVSVRLLTKAPLLLKWLNDFSAGNGSFTLQAYALDKGVAEKSMLDKTAADAGPEQFLVRVIYDSVTGQ